MTAPNSGDKDALSGLTMTWPLTRIQPQGPIPYTGYDVLKSFSWIIGIVKLIAHVFSLPIIVWLRSGFGLRAVDGIHVTLAFLVWMAVGMLSGIETALSDVAFAAPIAPVFAVLFLPMAFWQRYQARRALLIAPVYSYYPGLPHALWGKLLERGVAWLRSKIPSQFHWLLLHIPTSPEEIQGILRRFVEPALVYLCGFMLVVTKLSIGFGFFLIWTAAMMLLDESLTQRFAFEQFLDAIDAQVLAADRAQLADGKTGRPSPLTGIPLVRPARRGKAPLQSPSPANDNEQPESHQAL